MIMIRQIKPVTTGDSVSKFTSTAPAPWPISVTCLRLPPNDSMFSWTHRSAAVRSSRAKLPGASLSPLLRNPTDTQTAITNSAMNFLPQLNRDWPKLDNICTCTCRHSSTGFQPIKCFNNNSDDNIRKKRLKARLTIPNAINKST